MEGKLKLIKDCIKAYPDFPKPGILFRDVLPILGEPSLLSSLVDILSDRAKAVRPRVEVIVGLESRGFLFGVPVAMRLGVPFVPIRKKGKLPGPVISVEFSLEYGKDVVEIQKGTIKSGQSILVIDDLLATGGTLSAACQLVSKLEAEVAECLVIMEIAELKGREKVNPPVTALIAY